MITTTRHVIRDRLLFEDRDVYYSEKINGYVDSILDATHYADPISALNASTSVDEDIVEIELAAQIVEREELSADVQIDIIAARL